MLETVAPEEDPMNHGNLQCPFADQHCDLIKVSKESVEKDITYFLEVGTCLGLMSSALKWANQVSQGQAS